MRDCFGGYYADIHREKLVFDTNRLWCAKLALIAALFPHAKVICCARDVPWVACNDWEVDDADTRCAHKAGNMHSVTISGAP